MKNLSPAINVASIIITLLVCWTEIVQAFAACSQIQEGNPCSTGNFMPDQPIVTQAKNPLEVEPNGKTCQQGLDEIQVDCDLEGNLVDPTGKSRMEILKLKGSYCCEDLSSNVPACPVWSGGDGQQTPCGSDEIFRRDESLPWLNDDRTCQELFNEKLEDISIAECDMDGGFATDDDYKKIQLVVMELKVASCCQPAAEGGAVTVATTTTISAEQQSASSSTEGDDFEDDDFEDDDEDDSQRQPIEPQEAESAMTISSLDDINTSGAVALLGSYSSFWAVAVALFVTSFVGSL